MRERADYTKETIYTLMSKQKKLKRAAARSKREEAQARRVIVGIIIGIVVIAVVMIAVLCIW